MKHQTKIAILISLIIGAISVFGQMTLTMTGGVSETINRDDLTAGAGSDLASDYISSTSAASIDISSTSGSSWKVQVKKTDSTWDTDLVVYVRRTSDGSGSGTITGGGTYQQVTGTYADLFSGSDDRSSINVQVKLSGMAVADVGADTYSSSVSFKVVEDAKCSLLREVVSNGRPIDPFERFRDASAFEDEPDEIKSNRKVD
ncbi:MAG: hypothetical protein ACLFSQ_09190 [Candidatus Zixiibacteriota bacterium]